MKQTTRIALAGLLSAAGAALNAFASELNGSEATPEPAAPAEAPKKGKAKAAEKPAPATEAPAQAEEPKKEESTVTGKTYEELQALIRPVVKNGLGQEVKDVIKKYTNVDAGGLKILEGMPEHHAAFEKDILALSY